MLYGNKLGNLRYSRLFFLHTRALRTAFLSVRQLTRTRLFSSRAAHDVSYVASKKVLSAEGKGDSRTAVIKPAAHFLAPAMDDGS
jgi:hypothetical protein